MSNSKYNFSTVLTVLGLIFFVYIFLAGWGTDPSKYGQINDLKMDCKAILDDVDRVGVVAYFFNGKPDAPQHYYHNNSNRNYRSQPQQLQPKSKGVFQAAFTNFKNAGFGTHLLILILILAIYGPQFISNIFPSKTATK